MFEVEQVFVCCWEQTSQQENAAACDSTSCSSSQLWYSISYNIFVKFTGLLAGYLQCSRDVSLQELIFYSTLLVSRTARIVPPLSVYGLHRCWKTSPCTFVLTRECPVTQCNCVGLLLASQRHWCGWSVFAPCSAQFLKSTHGATDPWESATSRTFCATALPPG